MVHNRIEYKRIRELERCGYGIKSVLLSDEFSAINRYLRLLRKEEWLYNSTNPILRLLRLPISRIKNRLGVKLGLLIPRNVADEGLKIWHTGSVIINAKAKIGKNCVFHGNNCVGNKGISNEAPTIGDDVEIGFGAQIVGGVYIADGCKIGAGAVVTKSCTKPNTTLVGIPAREVTK